MSLVFYSFLMNFCNFLHLIFKSSAFFAKFSFYCIISIFSRNFRIIFFAKFSHYFFISFAVFFREILYFFAKFSHFLIRENSAFFSEADRNEISQKNRKISYFRNVKIKRNGREKFFLRFLLFARNPTVQPHGSCPLVRH